MRHAFIAKQRAHYPLRTLCKVMEVSVSGFHAYTLRQQRPDPDAAVRAQLRQAHAQSRGTYGRKRLTRVLREGAKVINHKRVARLMREEGLRGKSKGRFRRAFATGPGGHRRHVADNGLDRRFDVDSAPEAWVGDITSVPTRQGWLYLATVIDLRTRRVVGYSTSERMQEELVVNALRNAVSVHPVPPGALFHSDQGSQYAGNLFAQELELHGFSASMSRKGNCWDNAVAESFFATLKSEEASRPYLTRDDACAGIARYIHGFYNSERMHSSLDYKSPNEFAKQLKLAA